MLKKVPNISNYSIFGCLIFFLQSERYLISLTVSSVSFFNLKRFLTSLLVVSSISFFNLKRIFTSLIMLSPIFFLFQVLNFSSLYVVKKINNLFFLKNKSIIHLEIGFENTVFNPIQDGGQGGGVKKAPHQFFPCNIGFSPQNFLTFSFNPFATQV